MRRYQAVAAVVVAAGAAALLVAGVVAYSKDSPTYVPTGVGALPDFGGGSCSQEYSPAALKGRSFAFDGTVTSVGRRGSAGGDEPTALVAVDFRVDHWFAGGAGKTVTLVLISPVPRRSGNPPTPIGPSYGIGTRLLVSGGPSAGGAPLVHPVAWFCGFTRYYDAPTAEAWRGALE
jgi:hypothetical protein